MNRNLRGTIKASRSTAPAFLAVVAAFAPALLSFASAGKLSAGGAPAFIAGDAAAIRRASDDGSDVARDLAYERAFRLDVAAVEAAEDAGPTSAPAAPAADPDVSQLGDMSLENLMTLDVTAATLTRTEANLVPAAVTSIDRAMIDQANPRNLDELLDIYVPNFYYVYHQWDSEHIGIRGIVNADDKYLLVVNGRVMNERTSRGAISERDLVLLGDLNQVDVIRGPGSAIYGPGAIMGVVGLQTYNGLTYQGTSITGRGGIYEDFYSAEIKHGAQTGANSGYFVYFGAAKYNGADRKYSPFIQGYSFPADYGDVEAGHPSRYHFADNHSSYEGNPQLKFHAQLDADGLTLWTRYTNGGTRQTITERGWQAAWPYGWASPTPAAQSGSGYQQLTTFAGYTKELSKTLTLNISTSLDYTEFERSLPFYDNGNWGHGLDASFGEIKSISQALVHWTPAEAHQFAVGAEYRHFWLGLPSWRTPNPTDVVIGGNLQQTDGVGAFNSRFGDDYPRWQTDMLSFVGEYQWTITPQWTTFVGGRADKHTYTDWLFSPRGAIAYSPTEKDTIKAIASQSLRTNTEEEMRLQFERDGSDSDPEIARTYELRYERQQNENLFLAGSVFFNDIEVLAWDQSAASNRVLGNYQTVGAEVEGRYRTGDTTITASHGVVKLVDIDLMDGVTSSISAAPAGYGWDLANWPQQISKLTVHQQLSRKWSADSSLRVDWNFPGDKDFLAYANDHPVNNDAFVGAPPSSFPGWREPFGPSFFLNAGLQYQATEHVTLRFDAYNILGWIDHAYNKRDIVNDQWQGAYRAEAPAIGFSLKYEF